MKRAIYYALICVAKKIRGEKKEENNQIIILATFLVRLFYCIDRFLKLDNLS